MRHEAPLGWLVLNRPQVRNALNLRTWQLIVEGVTELSDDPDVRVIIMRVSILTSRRPMPARHGRSS